MGAHRRYVLPVRPDTMAAHRVRWFAVIPGAPFGEHRIPRNRHMAQKDWGWDAVCSCGYDTHTGGGIFAYVDELVRLHRSDEEIAQELGHTTRWNRQTEEVS